MGDIFVRMGVLYMYDHCRRHILNWYYEKKKEIVLCCLQLDT
jgi:hypothetical protein